VPVANGKAPIVPIEPPPEGIRDQRRGIHLSFHHLPFSAASGAAFSRLAPVWWERHWIRKDTNMVRMGWDGTGWDGTGWDGMSEFNISVVEILIGRGSTPPPFFLSSVLCDLGPCF
jgi:hypothetical protein